jgi:quercetin dioxygenase-like cupin family protein
VDAHAGTDDKLQPTVVNLLTVDVDGSDGAVWSLARGGDLDANLVHLGPSGVIGAHVNEEVDVLVVGIAGLGSVSIDSVHHELQPGTVVAVPKRSDRAIAAAPDSDVVYLTVHRARPGLRIARR